VSLLAQDERLTRRVGAIALAVLAALILFVVFVADRIEWGSHIRVKVYFHQTGGLREGASFVVAGQPAGRVESITLVPQGAHSPLGGDGGIAVTVAIDRSTAKLLHARPWPSACCSERQIGDVFVSARGVLSERFLELATAPEGSPVLHDGDQLLGSEPPTLDRVLQRTWDNMQRIRAFSDEVGPEIDALRAAITDLRAQIAPGSALGDAPFGELVLEASGAIDQARELRDVGLGGDAGLAKASSVITLARTTLADLRRTLDVLDTRAATLRAALARAQGDLSVKGPEFVAKIQLAIDRTRGAIDKIDPLLAQVDDIRGRIARGEGSLLKLARDPEFPEDAKDLGKFLKRHPWKIIDHPSK
jgi:ABC-type transporter Mla subunit MlaD